MKRIFIISFLTTAIIMGCGPKEEKAGIPVEKAIRVSVVKVRQERIVSQLRYSGTIEPFQTIPLSFQSNGTVKRVLADEGDEVYKGQLLAELDATDASNMYQITLAKYDQAKDAYDRLKTVYEKGSLTEVKWVEMETNLEQAESSLAISKNNLDKCRLYSPVAGIVGRRNIEPGMSSISLGSSPFEIIDIRQVYVKISVPENEVPMISKGMKASFSVSALKGREYVGEVTNISPVADKISRTYEAKILVSNTGQYLKAGMVCDAGISSERENDAITIPYQAIIKGNDNKCYVFVADSTNMRVNKREVKTGQYLESGLEIVSGLSEGQLVVFEGKEKLTDNCLIEL